MEADTTRTPLNLLRSVLWWLALCVLLTSGAGAVSRAAHSMGRSPWHLTRIHMVNTVSGWALGNDRRGAVILHTNDAGRHWANLSTKNFPPKAHNQDEEASTSDSMGAFFLNDRAAWFTAVCSDNNAATLQVAHTSDGGRSWSINRFPVPPDTSGSDIVFTDAGNGYILAASGAELGTEHKTIYRTSDGGRVWTKAADDRSPVSHREGLPSHAFSTGLAFRDVANGWMTASPAANDNLPLFRTSDRGKTWRPYPLDLAPAYRKSASSGTTYPPMFFGPQKNEGILPVHILNRVIEKEAIVVYVTHDGGGVWRGTTGLNVSTNLEGRYSFVDARQGWVLDATGANLYRTQDGGLSWQSVKPDRSLGDENDAETQLEFISRKVGWALVNNDDSETSSLFQTQDGGRHWLPLYSSHVPPQYL